MVSRRFSPVVTVLLAMTAFAATPAAAESASGSLSVGATVLGCAAAGSRPASNRPAASDPPRPGAGSVRACAGTGPAQVVTSVEAIVVRPEQEAASAGAIASSEAGDERMTVVTFMY